MLHEEHLILYNDQAHQTQEEKEEDDKSSEFKATL